MSFSLQMKNKALLYRPFLNYLYFFYELTCIDLLAVQSMALVFYILSDVFVKIDRQFQYLRIIYLTSEQLKINTRYLEFLNTGLSDMKLAAKI